jgi:CubicO group peptidase (beta-lactamase class C family)
VTARPPYQNEQRSVVIRYGGHAIIILHLYLPRNFLHPLTSSNDQMKNIYAFFLLFPIAASAQKNFTALLDQYMNAQVSVNSFSGTVLVAKHGKIIYEKAFGLADQELNASNNLKSMYQVGSVTKQFTACGILLLEEEGKLRLDDKLSRFFPGFPKGDSVTIHMLLTHTSGLKNTGDLDGFNERLPIEKDSMVELIKRQAYLFSPGTRWEYSNCGYFLLGCIIEKLSGESYSDFILEHIIKKAGLKNTFVNRWDTILPNRVMGYEKKTTGWKNAIHISMEGPFSAGAMISDVEDLYAWNKALYSGKIISASSLKKMTTPYMSGYGYGLGIDTFYKHTRIWHGGAIRGFTACLEHYPGDSVDVVVLSNNECNAINIANSLAATVVGTPVVAPYFHKEIKIGETVLNNYAGRYAFSEGDEFEIIKKDGKLYRKKPNSQIELKAESATKLFYADGSDRQIEFKVDKTGKVISTSFIFLGFKEELKKL